jgi:hypothetical protein
LDRQGWYCWGGHCSWGGHLVAIAVAVAGVGFVAFLDIGRGPVVVVVVFSSVDGHHCCCC